ncbi:hypothetical protein GCM10020001_024040 [Nonomuraea salmonea]
MRARPLTVISISIVVPGAAAACAGAGNAMPLPATAAAAAVTAAPLITVRRVCRDGSSRASVRFSGGSCGSKVDLLPWSFIALPPQTCKH